MHVTPPTTPTTTGGTRRRRGVLASIAVSTLVLGVLAAAPAQAEPVRVDIVGINDFHGRLEADTGTNTTIAGAAVLAGKVDQMRAAQPNTLFVSSGDNVGASTFTSFIQDDKPTLDALNAMKLDVSTPGNHEFDRGQDDFNDRILPASNFANVNANIFDTATGERAYQPYAIKEVDGVRVGFIGAITTLMPELVSPAGIEGLDFRDVAESVNPIAEQLTDGDDTNDEADALVLLVHEGAASKDIATSTDDSEFGRIAKNVSPKVDAILSAHTHQTYIHQIIPNGGTKPRPVIQTGSYSENLSHLSLNVDRTAPLGQKVTQAAAPENIKLFKSAPENPAVADIVAKAVAEANVKGAVKIGDITGDFLRAKQTDGSENRGGESTLGNFVADVQLAATAESNGAQIAFMNPGGLRADLRYASSGAGDPDGNLTYKEAAAVQPFANTLSVVTMTGAQIRAVLEQQWQPAGSSRPFLKLGVSKGFAYTYDPNAAAGQHVDTITLDGELLDEGATYKVTANSFLAAGGDNFRAFATGTTVADTGKADLQSQVDYFTANPAAAAPDTAQRSIGLSSPDVVGPQGYQIGDTITANLTSLGFSNGVVMPSTADVSYEGTRLGAVKLDNTIVDKTDEQGQATVQLKVVKAPAAAARALAIRSLEVTVPGTDTAVTLAAAIPDDATLQLVNAVAVDPGTPGDPAPGAGPGAGTGPGTGAAPGTGSVTGPGAATPARSGALAYTGSESTYPSLMAAVLLLLLGGTALVVARRRRRTGIAASAASTGVVSSSTVESESKRTA